MQLQDWLRAHASGAVDGRVPGAVVMQRLDTWPVPPVVMYAGAALFSLALLGTLLPNAPLLGRWSVQRNWVRELSTHSGASRFILHDWFCSLRRQKSSTFCAPKFLAMQLFCGPQVKLLAPGGDGRVDSLRAALGLITVAHHVVMLTHEQLHSQVRAHTRPHVKACERRAVSVSAATTGRSASLVSCAVARSPGLGTVIFSSA